MKFFSLGKAKQIFLKFESGRRTRQKSVIRGVFAPVAVNTPPMKQVEATSAHAELKNSVLRCLWLYEFSRWKVERGDFVVAAHSPRILRAKANHCLFAR
jgi:hypothetical protein